MIELYFVFYRIPKMMTRLARERGRSALWWSLAAIGAWFGAEFVVLLVYTLVHEFGVAFWGWSPRESAGMMLLSYAAAIAAAIGATAVVHRVLTRLPPRGMTYPPPPPPPQF